MHRNKHRGRLVPHTQRTRAKETYDESLAYVPAVQSKDFTSAHAIEGSLKIGQSGQLKVGSGTIGSRFKRQEHSSGTQ